MSGRTWLLLGVCTMALAADARAQPTGAAKAPSAPVSLEQTALDILKEVHNRGAELYNKGEPLGGLRLYEGALLTVKPFLAKHPSIQKIIDDGLDEILKTEGVKIQAFRLHEVIEEVRTKLKEEVKKGDIPKAEKPKEMPAVKPKESATANTVGGKLSFKGQPVAGAEIVIVSLSATDPKIFRATTGKDGTYSIATNPPVGDYGVKISGAADGPKLPAKFAEFATSGLKLKVAAGANSFDINLE